MRRRRHALSKAIYDVREDGNLDVVARDGMAGVFTPDSEWVSGDLRRADPHLCGWLAGPQLPPRVFNQDVYNVPQVQAGLDCMTKPGVTFADYQETKPRHFHEILSEWLAR